MQTIQRSANAGDTWQAAIAFLAAEFSRLAPRAGENPFHNSGAQIDCEIFQATAYRWTLDELAEDEAPNFVWRNVQLIWHKDFSRSLRITVTHDISLMNTPIENVADAFAMLNECVPAMRAHFAQNQG